MQPLYVWGNHHCSNQTGFRDKLHKLVSQHTDFNFLAFHTDFRLNLQEIERIPLSWQNWPATLILIFGDTNLTSQDSVESTIEVFSRLYEVLKALTNYTVITCGPILPWDPEPLLVSKFKALESELIRLNRAHPERYISLLHTFKPSDYIFDNHLSKQGSTLLARTILRALYNVERTRAFNKLQNQNGSDNLDSKLSKLSLSLADPE